MCVFFCFFDVFLGSSTSKQRVAGTGVTTLGAEMASALPAGCVQGPTGYSAGSLLTPRSLTPKMSMAAAPVVIRRQASPCTPRDRGTHPPTAYVPWPVRPSPARSSSAPRICPGSLSSATLTRDEGSVSAPIYAAVAGPVSLAPRLRHISTARSGQFIPCGPEEHRVLRGMVPPLEGLDAPGADPAKSSTSRGEDKAPPESSLLARMQQALAEQRAEHEVKLAQLQANWEQRFAEAVSFWHRAWSTTTAVVKDCNHHCVKLSEVLEASLDELGQNSIQVMSLASRMKILEETVGLSNKSLEPTQHPQESSQEEPPKARESPMAAFCLGGLSGTSDSFKRLSNELARFEHEVSAHSQQLLSFSPMKPMQMEESPPAAGQATSFSDWRSGKSTIHSCAIGKPQPQTTAGALPQREEASQAVKKDHGVSGAGFVPRPVGEDAEDDPDVAEGTAPTRFHQVPFAMSPAGPKP